MISTVLLTTHIIARAIIFYKYLWLHTFGQEKALFPGLYYKGLKGQCNYLATAKNLEKSTDFVLSTACLLNSNPVSYAVLVKST